MRIRVLAHAVGHTADERVRRAEPVTFGVPLPRGAVKDGAEWTCGSSVAQVRTLDRWADGSVRWALVDARADLDGGEVQELALEVRDHGDKSEGTEKSRRVEKPDEVVALSESAGAVVIDTGAARFQVRVGGRFPFDAVEAGGQAVLDPAGGGLVVLDAKQVPHAAEIRTVEIEERGPLRSVVRIAGSVAAGGGRRLDLLARAHFFASSPTVRLLVTLTNPERAAHPGGFWDLGDPGSVLIKDASIAFRLAGASEPAELYASPEIGAPWTRFDLPFEVYQDSSGGDNWQSSNHINRERRVPTTFRGYRLRAGDRAQAGRRATPIVALSRGSVGVALAVPAFWQNFPKAVEAAEGTLTLRLFPGQFGDLHEIQGGEQKTHELFVAFGPDGVMSVPLTWARARSVVGVAPDWALASGAVPFLAPLDSEHAGLLNSAVEGPHRFEAKREVIDEYGWRHFGEIYGDHEGANHKGATPLVSHYNNQYDPIAGFAYQFMRTSDPRWWTMMSELASHVIDIDVYHTSKDKSVYSHGMFWHTYHYGDADTSTHRTFPLAGKGRTHGGGPSADHNYTTGLMLHYFLTGNAASREIVLQQAQYVIDLDDGRKTVMRWLDSGPTGYATKSAPGYYGPGRGSANSVNALSDGFRLRGDRRFQAKVDEIVRRTVHPNQDLAALKLDDPEQRWFYTMFLQVLGKHLNAKEERSEFDDAYEYARASLLHYARWMIEHAYPSLEKPEKLYFPTETWPAQDSE